MGWDGYEWSLSRSAFLDITWLTAAKLSAPIAFSVLPNFASYVAAESHGHGSTVPPEFLAHMQADWAAGHSAVTQAATITAYAVCASP